MAQMALRLLLRLDGADRARGDSGLYNCTALNAVWSDLLHSGNSGGSNHPVVITTEGAPYWRVHGLLQPLVHHAPFLASTNLNSSSKAAGRNSDGRLRCP